MEHIGNTKVQKSHPSPLSPKKGKNWTSSVHVASPHSLGGIYIPKCVGHHFKNLTMVTLNPIDTTI
jgi:hypothetical protein